MHKRSEEESSGRVEKMEMRVRGDLWQKDSSNNDSQVLQDGSETCCEV